MPIVVENLINTEPIRYNFGGQQLKCKAEGDVDKKNNKLIGSEKAKKVLNVPIKKQMKPPIVFPSTKLKSFKIPRATKVKVPKWVVNGKLWLWALNVDENGQYNRCV